MDIRQLNLKEYAKAPVGTKGATIKPIKTARPTFFTFFARDTPDREIITRVTANKTKPVRLENILNLCCVAMENKLRPKESAHYLREKPPTKFSSCLFSLAKDSQNGMLKGVRANCDCHPAEQYPVVFVV
jgi:hypothetical protein